LGSGDIEAQVRRQRGRSIIYITYFCRDRGFDDVNWFGLGYICG
jgi:hypothetical protein